MKAITSILTVTAILFFSCNKDSLVDSGNFIANSNFETGTNQPDYSGWTGSVYFIDSSGNQNPPLVQDAPNGGGLWSVQLEPLWIPAEGFTETSITGQTGTHIYKLTAWMKTIGWIGSISFEHWRNGQRIDNKELSETSKDWKQVSLTDTLTTFSTDTLKIHLSAGYCEFCWGRVLFDIVKLKKIR